MAAFDYDTVRARLDALQTRVWPAERLRLLVDGHEAETPFKVLAGEIGGGATKNACIGQAHRIGLPTRDPYAMIFRPRKPEPRPKPVKVPKPPRPPKITAASLRHTARPEVAEALALPGLAPVLISALARTQCKWPVGDPKAADFAFCGRLKPEDGPYCAAHAGAAFTSAGGDRAVRADVDRLARMTPQHRRSGAWA